MENRPKVLIIQSPFMTVNLGGTCYGGIESYINSLVMSCHYWHANDDEALFDVIVTAEGSITDRLVQKGHRIFKTESPSKEHLGKGVKFPYGQIAKILGELDLGQYDLILNNSDKVIVNSTLYNLSKNRYNSKLPIVSYIHNPPIYRGSEQTAARFLQMSDLISFVAQSEFNQKMWNTITNSDFMGLVNLGVADLDSGNLHPKCYNPKLFCSIGRLVPHKNFPLYVELAKSTPDSKFIWIGRGEIPKIELPDNLWLKPNLSQEALVKFLREESPVMVSTSTEEMFGMTAAEGFSLGLPMITFDFPSNNIANIVNSEYEYDYINYTVSDLGVVIKTQDDSRTKSKSELVQEFQKIARKLDNEIRFIPDAIKDVYAEKYKLSVDTIYKFISKLKVN